jgi:hypothetical protein
MKHPIACAAVAALLGAAADAEAQLYRWRDPDSGAVKLSSVPPPWYARGVSRGPHVDVIVGGKVVDPLAQPRAAPVAAPADAALPPPRIAPPLNAGKEQLVAAVVAGLRLPAQFDGWAGSIGTTLDDALRARGADDATRQSLRAAAADAYRADRLQAYFVKAFTAEVTEADLREVIEVEQTPLGRRVAALEANRAPRAALDPREVAAAEARASPERRAIAADIEQAVQGAELMAASVAGVAAAVALAAPEEQRLRVAELLQRQRAELQPALRQTFVRLVLYNYEPLSDAELRAVLELQRRPAVARVNRAVGLGYAAVVQESLSAFLAAARPMLARR